MYEYGFSKTEKLTNLSAGTVIGIVDADNGVDVDLRLLHDLWQVADGDSRCVLVDADDVDANRRSSAVDDRLQMRSTIVGQHGHLVEWIFRKDQLPCQRHHAG